MDRIKCYHIVFRNSLQRVRIPHRFSMVFVPLLFLLGCLPDDPPSDPPGPGDYYYLSSVTISTITTGLLPVRFVPPAAEGFFSFSGGLTPSTHSRRLSSYFSGQRYEYSVDIDNIAPNSTVPLSLKETGKGSYRIKGSEIALTPDDSSTVTLEARWSKSQVILTLQDKYSLMEGVFERREETLRPL